MKSPDLQMVLVAALSFFGGWMILHALMVGVSTGVIMVREEPFVRKRGRFGSRNASDFWFIFCFYGLFGLFFWLILACVIALLSFSPMGIWLIVISLVVLACVAIRPTPEKKAKPNIAFAYISIFTALICCLSVIAQLFNDEGGLIILLIDLTLSISIITTNIIKLIRKRFLFNQLTKKRNLRRSAE